MDTDKVVSAAISSLAGISMRRNPGVGSTQRDIRRDKVATERGATAATSSLEATSKPDVISRFTAVATSKISMDTGKAMSLNSMGMTKATAVISRVTAILSNATARTSKVIMVASKAMGDTENATGGLKDLYVR